MSQCVSVCVLRGFHECVVCALSLSAHALYLCVHVSLCASLSVGCKMIDEVLIWISFFKDHAIMRANLFTRECAQQNVSSNRRVSPIPSKGRARCPIATSCVSHMRVQNSNSVPVSAAFVFKLTWFKLIIPGVKSPSAYILFSGKLRRCCAYQAKMSCGTDTRTR